MSKLKKTTTTKNVSRPKATKSYQAPSLKKMQKLEKVTGGLKLTGVTDS
ncbi:MAG: hypothetical protein RLY14_958 [Planctomycetota bacterium]|jgi:hypothetical protein